MENQTKKSNWTEATRRLFYVAWAIMVGFAIFLRLFTSQWDVEDTFLLVISCILPYPLMLGIRWVYAGLKKPN